MEIRPASKTIRQRGVTMVEVMISIVLVTIALGNIFGITTQSLHALRTTRQVAGSSRVLQQRIEMIRAKPWSEISNATALATLMQTPTESERELTDAGLVETVTVTVAQTPGVAPVGSPASFRVDRRSGAGRVCVMGDLGTQPVLLVEVTANWQNLRGTQQRQLRTFVCRTGLTRSGVFGSAVGRAGQAPPPSLSP